jgi:hypothetical protein
MNGRLNVLTQSNMKKMFFSVLAVGFLAIAGVASAQMGMMGNYWQSGNTTQLTQSQEVNNTLQDIYKSQNVSSQGQVDCSKVNDDQFEKLGDAYMGVMLPNPQQHEVMDNMMGGEGSSSLRLAHINMGRSYLGCWSDYNSGPVYIPMMGGGYGMMGGDYNNSYYPGSMMGGYFGSYSWFGLITMLLLWALLVLGIVMAVKWLRKK